MVRTRRGGVLVLMGVGMSLLAQRALAQSTLQLHARTGDPVPGYPGQFFMNFGTPFINNAGDVAFQANLQNAQGQFSGMRGAFLSRGGTVRALLVTGDAVTGLPEATLRMDSFPGPANLDNLGNVLVNAVWFNGVGSLVGYSYHVDSPTLGRVTLAPAVQAFSSWPALWNASGVSQVFMSGGVLAATTSQGEIWGGSATGPLGIAWTTGRPSPGWPCVNATLGAGTCNALADNGQALIMTSVACGNCGASCFTGVLHQATLPSGASTEFERGCPHGASSPQGVVDCGAAWTVSPSNAMMSASGRTTWTRSDGNGQTLALVRDGQTLPTPADIAQAYTLPGETLWSATVSSIGDDATLTIFYTTRTTGGEWGSRGLIALHGDGSSSLVARVGEPLFAGGPAAPEGFSPSSTNAQGVSCSVAGGGSTGALCAWSRATGWRRVLGTGDEARLSSGDVVRLVFPPSTLLTSRAGTGRGVNDTSTVAASITVIDATVPGEPFDAVVTLALAVSPGDACDAIDFNNDTLTPDSGDLDDFVAVLAGGPGACSTFPSPGCNDVDFNNDGFSPDSLDLDAFLVRLAGGPCVQ